MSSGLGKGCLGAGEGQDRSVTIGLATRETEARPGRPAAASEAVATGRGSSKSGLQRCSRRSVSAQPPPPTTSIPGYVQVPLVRWTRVLFPLRLGL